MNQQIAVKSVPASLYVDFELAKEQLETELKEYDVVVTGDTVKGAKELATDLNKRAAFIDQLRKDEVAKVSEPIKVFEGQMKTLVTMCKDGRQKLLTQVQKFEDETRDKVSALLFALRGALFDEFQVRTEFKRAEFDDLIIISNLTSAGNLTSKAIGELKNRVMQDRAVQDRTDMRLAQLENESIKAGLSAPLTREHVRHFLFADDATYSDKLTSLLCVEIDRQKATEEVMRKKLEAEKAPEPVKQEEPKPEPKREQVACVLPPEGTTAWVINARFEVSAPNHVKPEAIENKLRELLDKAGITSLKSIEVSHA